MCFGILRPEITRWMTAVGTPVVVMSSGVGVLMKVLNE